MWIKHDKMEIDTRDKEKICRTCLTQTDVRTSIFTNNEISEDKLKFHEMLRNCTFIHVRKKTVKCDLFTYLYFKNF